jgi:hypothetical protein
MPKFFNPVTLIIIALSLFTAPAVQAGVNSKKININTGGVNESVRNKARKALIAEEAAELYDQMDLKDAGLSKHAFQYAFSGYTYLLTHNLLTNENVLSICDFSQSSRRKRLYVLDLGEKTILINTYVAHGRRTGGEFARSFSNRAESHKSSLGFYITQQEYLGDNGISLKIHGVERGFNDKADARGIVMHGSDYVGSDFLRWNKFNGRSFGCPAVPSDQIEQIIETIKNGSCLFIYHPTKKYLAKSKILNS